MLCIVLTNLHLLCCSALCVAQLVVVCCGTTSACSGGVCTDRADLVSAIQTCLPAGACSMDGISDWDVTGVTNMYSPSPSILHPFTVASLPSISLIENERPSAQPRALIGQSSAVHRMHPIGGILSQPWDSKDLLTRTSPAGTSVASPRWHPCFR